MNLKTRPKTSASPYVIQRIVPARVEGTAPILLWESLAADCRRGIAKRLARNNERAEVTGTPAGDPAVIWNEQFDLNRRLKLLNVRAFLQAIGLWEHVYSVCYLRVISTPRLLRPAKVHAVADLGWGWELAIKTSTDVRSLISSICPRRFKRTSRINHPEAAWSVVERGDEFVLHLLGLRAPAQQFTTLHFDRGPRSIFNFHHLRDYWYRTGPEAPEVTRSLLRGPAGCFLAEASTELIGLAGRI